MPNALQQQTETERMAIDEIKNIMRFDFMLELQICNCNCDAHSVSFSLALHRCILHPNHQIPISSVRVQDCVCLSCSEKEVKR